MRERILKATKKSGLTLFRKVVFYGNINFDRWETSLPSLKLDRFSSGSPRDSLVDLSERRGVCRKSSSDGVGLFGGASPSHLFQAQPPPSAAARSRPPATRTAICVLYRPFYGTNKGLRKLPFRKHYSCKLVAGWRLASPAA